MEKQRAFTPFSTTNHICLKSVLSGKYQAGQNQSLIQSNSSIQNNDPFPDRPLCTTETVVRHSERDDHDGEIWWAPGAMARVAYKHISTRAPVTILARRHRSTASNTQSSPMARLSTNSLGVPTIGQCASGIPATSSCRGLHHGPSSRDARPRSIGVHRAL